MTALVGYLVTLLSGIALGALLHKLTFTLNHEKQIKQIQNEHTRANEELRRDLSEQLGKMRGSIIQVAETYSKTVGILQNRLPDKNNPSIYLDLQVTSTSQNLIKKNQYPESISLDKLTD